MTNEGERNNGVHRQLSIEVAEGYMPVAIDSAMGEEVTVGVEPEFRARLPLSPAEACLATNRQLNRIGHEAVKRILSSTGNMQRLDFSQLRDEVNMQTGIGETRAA